MRVLAALAFSLGTSGVVWGAQSAAERYRDRLVTSVDVVLSGAPVPEAAADLVEVRAGELYRQETIRRSIRQLFALGAFSDIKVQARPDGEGVALLFRLFPRLRVAEVRLRGLDGDDGSLAKLESALLEEAGVSAGDPLEVNELENAAARVEEALRDRGYLWATVELEASFQSPSAAVVFHVESSVRARVGAIAVTGVAPHVVAHMRRSLPLGSGRPYSRVELERALDDATDGWRERGFYQARVDYEELPRAGSLVDLHLAVALGPKIEVEVDGATFSQLSRLVPLLSERRFTEDLVEESRANLENRLRERGHRDALVRVERETWAEGGRLTLRFLAEPGPLYRVASIRLEGLARVPESEVGELLLAGEAGLFRSAAFRRELFEDDLERVRRFLERRGFHSARVRGEEISDADRPEALTLVVRVEEGPRAGLASVEVEGASSLPPEAVLAASALTPGDVFDASEVVEAQERIVTRYRNEGYRRAAVDVRTELDETGTKANVTFLVREGDRTLVDRVILSGLETTRESAARRLVSLGPGEPVSTVELLETRQRLVGSGLFSRVDVEVLPADPLTNRSDVLITLEEGPKTSFAYGFGYEERQLARAELELTRRNLFGLDRTVSVFTRGSFRGSRFITTYRQPEVLGLNLPLFISGFAEEEDRSSFDFNRVGVGLQLSKRLGEDQTLFFRYRFDRTKVFGVEVDLDDIDRRFRNVFLSTLSVASVSDTRDDPITPRGGGFRILDVEWSARPLGTRSPYLRSLAQQFLYFSLPHDMVAAVGLRLGVAQSFREDRDALIPITERFFAGGATTLRGFGLDEASPRRKLTVELDTGETTVIDGEPLGGNVLALLNLELRFPIVGNLRGVFFSDNGNVYRRLSVIDLLNWRYNLGFGFRYETPLGPLRVDYGVKLDRRTRTSIDCPDIATPCLESRGRWHVSLGHAF